MSVNKAEHVRFQSPYAIDNLLDVGNGPSFESTSGRVQSNKVKGELRVLRVHRLAFVSLSASLLNAYEMVHDYMEVTTYPHLSQSSLVQLLPVHDEP